MKKVDLNKEIKELKNQIAFSKNIGFFLGAGTSCALGIPNVDQLTAQVGEALNGDEKASYDELKANISLPDDPEINIEHILNHIRLVRELTNDSNDKGFQNLNGDVAKKLDLEICKKISEIITTKEEDADLKNPTKFFAWLNQLSRDFTKEIFTTNYDLIIEKSLERIMTPYFDGFIGSNEPFFFYESIDNSNHRELPPKSWIRLWKMHGSLNWFWKQVQNSNRIIRVNKKSIESDEKETVIFPSRKKYDLSRKQPFIAYFDRLKNYLQSGELLFLFSGYSFSDEHINEIVFNSLRQNNRLFAVILFFKDEEVEAFIEKSPDFLNLNVFGPTKCILKGELAEYEFDEDSVIGDFNDFWDSESKKLKIGNFNHLVDFLVQNSGKSEKQLLNRYED